MERRHFRFYNKAWKIFDMRKFLIALGLTVGIIGPVVMLSQPVEGYRWPAGEPPPAVVPRSVKMQLSLILRGLSEMDQSPSGRLNPRQAQRMVTLLSPWQKKAQMSEGEAKALCARLANVLSEGQRDRLEVWLQGFGPPGGFYDAADPVQRQRIEYFRQNYNPLYPPGGYEQFKYLPAEMQERYRQRYQARRTIVEQWRRKAQAVKAETEKSAA